MLQELKTAKKVVGIKQLRKALKEDCAARVYLADNADPRLTDPIRALCEERGIPVETVETMLKLGESCGIQVGAAAAAILR